MKAGVVEYDDHHIQMFLEKLFWHVGEGPSAAQHFLSKLAYGEVEIWEIDGSEYDRQIRNLEDDLMTGRRLLCEASSELKRLRKDNVELIEECESYADEISQFKFINDLVHESNTRRTNRAVKEIQEKMVGYTGEEREIPF